MADTTKYNAASGKLIVHRKKKERSVEIRCDEFEHRNLRASVIDNGSLIITADNQPIAAYPAGIWLRVTPDTAE